ncbi:type IV pilus modification PilV family protein [Argonema galeatum]|uniref:type IV pilus modification PilV family protein n=1 Tax=Argonema galeatum TaxID=2942762 RepID=UPI002012107D|nr:type II secretion system protein [Argonema galeatum]MCL1464468.1 type II secretion system GspH family protein [Argonema galeatum A003/A1]
MLSLKTQSIQKSNTMSLALALLKLSKPNSSQQGISLLECLMAITVISVVISSFTPPIFLAVATQIQNRRAEQAVQLAQAEIDRVRSIAEQQDYANTDLPPEGATDVKQQSPPSGTTPNRNSMSATTGLLVDVNGDGTQDFVVQTYRNTGVPDSTGKKVAFNMGVRVYAAVITQNYGLLESPPQRSASLQLTTALGAQKRRPLAVMYTTVTHSDDRNSLCNLQKFLGDLTGSGCQ